MSFFGINFGGGAEIDIILDESDSRKMADIKDENGRKERFFLFYDGESVSGKVNITLHRKTGRLEHQGIKIELIGNIEMYFDRGTHLEFLSLTKELARPGDLTQNASFDFEFNQVEKPYETYAGVNVRLRYFLKVTMERRLTNLTKELDLAVHTLATYPDMNNPIKMEVGIEECLHIEFEYNKSKYHLKDVIVGKIYFLLVRIKIKHMEIAIIKRETCGTGPNTYQENENIAKYEIMDGAPVRGESIPIRVFLAGYDLTPTMRDINKKFSVRYYLNLVLVDEEDRRYFKQQEITLWRKGERSRKLPLSGSLYQQQHALARHTAGDHPTEGVRTAPTPSLPPTPCVDNNPGFPSAAILGVEPAAEREPADGGEGDDEPIEGEVVENAGDMVQSNGERKEEKETVKDNVVHDVHKNDAKDDKKNDADVDEAEDAVTSDKTSAVVTNSSPTPDHDSKSQDEDKSSNSIQSNSETADSKSSSPEVIERISPPDLVSAVANLNLGDDKTVDLDVVSTITIPPSSPPPDMDAVLDDDDDLSPDSARDSPPEMMDTPSSPDIDLPDPPGSEPDSPQLQKKISEEPIPAAEAI